MIDDILSDDTGADHRSVLSRSMGLQGNVAKHLGKTHLIGSSVMTLVLSQLGFLCTWGLYIKSMLTTFITKLLSQQCAHGDQVMTPSVMTLVQDSIL